MFFVLSWIEQLQPRAAKLGYIDELPASLQDVLLDKHAIDSLVICFVSVMTRVMTPIFHLLRLSIMKLCGGNGCATVDRRKMHMLIGRG